MCIEAKKKERKNMSCESVNSDLLVKVMNVKPNSIIEVHLHLNFVCIWTSANTHAQDIGG